MCSPPVSEARVPGVVGPGPLRCAVEGTSSEKAEGQSGQRAGDPAGARDLVPVMRPNLPTPPPVLPAPCQGGNVTRGHQVCFVLSSLQRAWGCLPGLPNGYKTQMHTDPSWG